VLEDNGTIHARSNYENRSEGYSNKFPLRQVSSLCGQLALGRLEAALQFLKLE